MRMLPSGYDSITIITQIVNRVWDRGKKSRFRNVFERGVLHLQFDFKKYIYKFSQPAFGVC